MGDTNSYIKTKYIIQRNICL